MLFAVPAAVGLWLLAECFASVLFQGKNFTAADVMQTAVAIEGYAAGLIGLIGIKIIAPAFYARKDIRTPVKAAVASVVFVQACNFVTVPAFSHAGLALSVALGACFNALCLLTVLLKRSWYKPEAGWLLYFVRTLLAAAVLGAVLWGLEAGFAVGWAQMQSAWIRRLVLAAGAVVAAGVTYFAVLAVFGWRAQELRGAVQARRSANR